ncbi:MAG: cytochrome b/b6 domain-containing protein [Chloroflexi bacterium]|nr:cytochrome b/b6 domain-containing protein [Chloroflexota bacterium]
MSNKKRYRPLWVSLHWLMAALVFVTFGIGLTSLGKTASSTGKLIPLAVHLILGIAILLIVVFRYILRVLVFMPLKRTSAAPVPSLKKTPFLDQLSFYVHPLLYLFSALMALLGIAIALPANLFPLIFAHAYGQLPPDFYIYPARSWHGSLSLVLLVLIAQHVLVAIFHQFLKGENFLGRMWFTKK